MESNIMERLLNAGINPDSAIERFMGNEALYIKYLLRFADDDNYQKLCRSMEKEDCKSAFMAAHTLKGVCGNLSITRMEQLLRNQVEYLRNGDLKKASNMMEPLEKEYESVRNAIDYVRENA